MWNGTVEWNSGMTMLRTNRTAIPYLYNIIVATNPVTVVIHYNSLFASCTNKVQYSVENHLKG